MKLTLDQGKSLVRFARKSIESYFEDSHPTIPDDIRDLTEERGVFVTLERYPNHDLRGCIGYPEPVMPLIEAIESSARSAAFKDPRFQPVARNELSSLIVEVSVLTKPTLIEVNDPKEYLQEIKVGRDGLVVENGPFRGLLLPQVPVEWKWNAEKFLSQTCVKAGLPQNSWQDQETKIYKFTAQIFSESEPDGVIVEKKIGD